ncbi:hypothetical protein DACRYDRAFT_22127 [Dacryopinax primogenitus]|uniref:Uncharacterized protein n=1 Tax=Dacryopinax primogenitus (strain DJM 731) TaxID=1858805 RepID=M5FWY7_DACPD|nr:uncharacterized protein DACRYDRAFT_22127 [Dacryopinax primogenitus]EJU02506.1 hypothetical protein DACRYDRAFT_22127 [Dacryopinax primogenitus]
MISRHADDSLPTTSTYVSGSTRSRRRPSWSATSRRRSALCLTCLVIVGLVFHRVYVPEWKSTTFLWKAQPSSATLGDCRPAPAYTAKHGVTEQWTSVRLQEMIDRTKGFYARDYSLWLGWNNVRYIIEAGVLQAGLLNRTLIIPSFVYARQCEFSLDACAAFLDMVNRGDAIGWDEWRMWPMDKQMGWKIPIGMMIDLNHLRKTHAVVTVAEYLELQSLTADLEQGNGQWSDAVYQARSRPIPNSWWDPPGVIRVDQEQPPFVLNEDDPISLSAFDARETVGEQIESLLKDQPRGLLEWSAAEDRFHLLNVSGVDDSSAELFLRAAGFEVLHTYQGSLNTEFTKSVATPTRQVARRSEVHGVVDDFGSWSDQVIHLEGEVHLDRKPGGLRFADPSRMREFTHTVLYDVRTLPKIEALAVRIDERMRERTSGRLWRAAHVRRGDFVNIGWAGPSLEQHIEIVKSKLDLAPAILTDILNNQTTDVLENSGEQMIPTMLQSQIPYTSDPFYIATDERNPWALDYIRSQGGLLITDLFEPEDRHIVGWPLLITDILALAEQHVLARAAYFYGSGMSSVTGGVINLRSVNGWHPRTTTVD